MQLLYRCSIAIELAFQEWDNEELLVYLYDFDQGYVLFHTFDL